MSIYDDTVAIPRKIMVLLFIIDCSGSMKGSKIGAVNQAIEEVIPDINDISIQNADAKIKIGVIKFATGAHLLTEEPVDVENFFWQYTDASGLTDFGQACELLNEKLSKNGFMKSATGAYAPAIILLSDGEPTDNFVPSLTKLKENNWFKNAIKVAIAVGNDAKLDMLAEFTGNSETVLDVHNPQALKNIIKFVSVASSQIASRSVGVDRENGIDSIKSKQQEIIDRIKNDMVYSADADDVDEW